MTDTSEQKTLNAVYGALAAMTVLSFVPHMTVATIALLLFIIIFIALYVVKSKAHKDGVVENHMIYLIRTLWIVQLIAVITLTVACIYLLPLFDSSALEPCTNKVANMAMSDPNINYQAMSDEIQPCMDQMMADNRTALLNATLIAGIPVLLYLLFRLFKGGSRALKGYRVANPKGWF